MADVQGALSAAYANAQSLVADAATALDGAMSLLSPQYVTDPGEIHTPPPPGAFDLPPSPVITDVAVGYIPELDSPPRYTQIPPFNPGVQFPSNGPGDPPEPRDPGIEPVEVGRFDDQPPEPGRFDPPRRPDPFNGQIDQLDAIVIPQAPVLASLEFNGVAPVDPGIDGSAIGSVFMPTVDNISHSMRVNIEGDIDRMILRMNPRYFDQLNILENKLEEYASGNVATGLKQSVEDAIYERSKSKVDAETARVQADAWMSAAKRGFTLPNGALMAAVQSARQAGADANSTSAREIVVMQAEMAQKNIQFALSASADLRKTIIQASISTGANAVQMYGQAVQHASAFVDSLVKAASIAVDAFKSKIEIYKAEASVYETLAKASMYEVEVYKAKIDAEKAKSDVNLSKVSVFKAKVDAHSALVGAYGKEVDGVVAAASVDKIRIDAFVAKTQAFSAKAQAAAASYEAIKAAWQGEAVRVSAYEAKARAYSAQVDGYSAAARAEEARMSADGAAQRAQFEAWAGKASAVKGHAEAEGARVEALVKAQESLIHAYSAEVQAIIAQATSEVERYRAETQVVLENGKMKYQLVVQKATSDNHAIQGTADIAVSAGKAYAAVAESAMSGVTTLVSLSETATSAALGTAA